MYFLLRIGRHGKIVIEKGAATRKSLGTPVLRDFYLDWPILLTNRICVIIYNKFLLTEMKKSRNINSFYDKQ